MSTQIDLFGWNEQIAEAAIARVEHQAVTLRPYQVDCVNAAFEKWQTHNSTLVNLPTGCGKSVVFAEVMRRWDTKTDGRILLIAHRKELIYQAVGHARRAGLTSAIEMAGQWAHSRADVVIASVATLTALSRCKQCLGDGCSNCTDGKVRRFTRFDPDDFGLLTIDECFPAGTIIDGKPIEDIMVGDIVTAYDAVTKRTIPRRVVRVFKNLAPSTMVRITASGRSVVATPNHPFLTQRGFVNAKDVTTNDCLFGMWDDVSNLSSTRTEAQRRHADLLQSIMCWQAKTQAYYSSMRELWLGVRGSFKAFPFEREQRNCRLLLDRMYEKCNESAVIKNHRNYEQKIRFGSNETQQSNAKRGSAATSFGNDESSWAETANARWQRTGTYESGSDILNRNATIASCVTNQDGTQQWLSESLQNRFSRASLETCSRNRWQESFEFTSSASRQTQARILDSSRVDSVEVFECGRRGQPSELCPDGYVYNFEVEGEHTYIANGFAVHNCHHATAASFRKVATWFQQNPKLKELFVTATPNRTDKVGLHNVCQSVAYEMSIETAINEGWLVPIRQKFVTVEGLDISQVKVSQGDLSAGELQSAFLGTDETEERLLHAIVKPTIEEAAGRKTLVFASGKEHAVKLTAAFVANGVDAEYVTDDTDETTRANIVARFRDGDLLVLVNCMVFTEGFDAPATSVIANCRPTKSESLYLQIIGRATRPLAGVVDGPATAEARQRAIDDSAKTHCLVLDFVGVSGKHKPKSVIDILAGSRLSKMELDEAVAVAKRTGEELDIEKLVERVKQAREAKQAAREKRMTRTKADRADYTATDVALFGGPKFKADSGTSLASKKQRWVLTKLCGVQMTTARKMPMHQASAIISQRAKSVERNWQAQINNARTIGELREVGERINVAKTNNFWLKNDATTERLRVAWVARKVQLNGAAV